MCVEAFSFTAVARPLWIPPVSRVIRKQPDRGTVDYPANWSRPAPTALHTIPNVRFQAETRASQRPPIIPPQQSIFVVLGVCRRVGCVGFLREFLWRSLPERVLERGYTAYTPTHPRIPVSVSIE